MTQQSEALPQKVKTVAILVDWENLRKTLDTAIKKYKIKREEFSYNDIGNLLDFIISFVEPYEEIYRIFFYLTPPKEKAEWKGQFYSIEDKPEYKKIYENSLKFIENLRLNNYVPIRKGKLEFRGYDQNQKPIFTQKQVDMLIGLDIAHLSYLKLVDRVLLFSLDTDLIPAVKIARINGLQVIIPSFEDIRKAHYDLQEHADFIRKINIIDVIKSRSV